jgi:putative intracellular protease/amidase
MQRGLDGRRIALAVLDPDAVGAVNTVRTALERASAQVDVLEPGAGEDEAWHGGRYAALVVLGGEPGGAEDPRLTQLLREFLVSEKPVAAMGAAVGPVVNAGGAAGRTCAVDQSLQAALETAGGKVAAEPIHTDGNLISAASGADVSAFAGTVVAELTRALEEQDVDAMSEQSFPASDPPATSPASVGHVAPDTPPRS